MSPSQKKRVPRFRENKKAFDTVMQCYRDSGNTSKVGAMQYNDGGSAVRNPATPTPLDFRCDVDRVIRKCIKDAYDYALFFITYVCYDTDDTIEFEMNADKQFGPRRHNLEQGIGALFITRRIYPCSGKKGYFSTIRRKRHV